MTRSVAVAVLGLALLIAVEGARADEGEAGQVESVDSHPGDAQSGDGLVMYLDGGVSFPTAPPEFSEFWNTGWTASVGLGIELAPAWELVMSAHYERYGANEEKQIEDLLLTGPGGVLEIESIDGRDVDAVGLLAELRFDVAPLSSTWRPFLGFGAGVLQVSTTDATVTPADPSIDPVPVSGDSDVAFAASIGGGVAKRVSASVRVVAHASYLIAFTEQSSTESIPIRIGLAFD